MLWWAVTDARASLSRVNGRRRGMGLPRARWLSQSKLNSTPAKRPGSTLCVVLIGSSFYRRSSKRSSTDHSAEPTKYELGGALTFSLIE